MDIRLVTPHEKQTVQSIWQYCFADSPEYVSWYFKRIYTPENTLGLYEKGRLVSCLQMIPHNFQCRAKIVKGAYLVGVTTLPEARGKHYVSELMKKALEIMHKRGHILSVLVPFYFDFYRSYGWELCYSHLTYELPISKLSPAAKPCGVWRPVLWTDIPALSGIYSRYMKHRHFYIRRNMHQWQCLIEEIQLEKGYGYILENEGKMNGYILYSIENNVFHIHELAYENFPAFQSIMDFIYKHFAQAQTVKWNAPYDDMLYLFLKEPRHTLTVSPFAMGRIVNVIHFFEQLSLPENMSPFSLTISLKDPYAPWNDGCFMLNISDGKVTAAPIEANCPDCHCSINTFTQMAAGYLSPVQAYQTNRLKTKEEKILSLLDCLFPPCHTYLSELY